MAYIHALDQKQNILGNIGGMIRDPFQVPRNRDQVQRLWDVLRIAFHEAYQLVVARGAEAIHGVVRCEHAASQIVIAIYERIQTLTHHRLDQRRHVTNVYHWFNHRFRKQRNRPLRDADRQIAHPLQIGVDLQRRDDESQIRRHGLLGRQQIDGELIDLDLDRIDALLVLKDLLGGATVLLRNCGDAALYRSLDQRSHLQELAVELIQLFHEMTYSFDFHAGCWTHRILRSGINRSGP